VRHITSIIKATVDIVQLLRKNQIDVIYRGAWKWELIGLTMERVSKEKLC